MSKQKNMVVWPVLFALVVGLAGGYWYAVSTRREAVQTVPQKEGEGAEQKALFYRNPMNPAITSPVPAKDEMGMDYIPVFGDEEKGAKREPAGTVTIDPVIVQDIGVRTAVAQKKVLHRQIRAVGRVGYDEERLYGIHPKIEGWIEKLYVQKKGENVKKDEVLLSLYSPQLVASQQEYLVALKNYETLKNSPVEDIRRGAGELVESARKRLEFFDVPSGQLAELTKKQIVRKNLYINSPYTGTVIDLGVREGDYVTPKTNMYTLADLSRVWVYVDVYEFELPWIQENDLAEMTFAAIPGRLFKSRIDYIYPYMEEKTRTVKVRLQFDNEEGLLKPDMFTNVTVSAGRDIEAVVIPTEAIVRTGERNLVFIRRDGGKFEPREVRTGVTAEGLTRILDGVEPGELVVTSSQFLIDSESKLREATAKMLEGLQAAPAPADSAKGTADMDMSDMSMESSAPEDLDMSGMTLEDQE